MDMVEVEELRRRWRRRILLALVGGLLLAIGLFGASVFMGTLVQFVLDIDGRAKPADLATYIQTGLVLRFFSIFVFLGTVVTVVIMWRQYRRASARLRTMGDDGDLSHLP
jgi:hypothetical protein